VSWKHEIQLLDLPLDERLEVTCTKCGYMRYLEVSKLMKNHWFKQYYLDEIESRQRCVHKGCGSPCRIALTAEHETEGFQGGLA